jgi:MFS family permease
MIFIIYDSGFFVNLLNPNCAEMKTKIKITLSLMMFFQYYIWGSWYVTMGTFMSKYLGSTGIQIGAAYSALAIATMISPFFVGMIADRSRPI